jgi:hypothetical protein
MINERLQILITSDQRRRLEAEARRRETSVASLIREAIDARFGAVTRADRQAALQEIRGMTGRFLDPDEINRLVAQERELALLRNREPESE